jgi:hypothetical protein
MLVCDEKAAVIKDRCPLLVPGGVQCNHRATVVPQEWELPPYCVPGQAVCACCYQEIKDMSGAYRNSLHH